jgi:hypothetical protein
MLKIITNNYSLAGLGGETGQNAKSFRNAWDSYRPVTH